MKNVLFIEFYGGIVNVGKDKYYDISPNFDVWNAIKTIKPDYVFIMENEPCKDKKDSRDTDFKYEYFRRSLVKFLDDEDIFAEYSYCPFDDPSNDFRKPNTAMYSRMLWKYANCDYHNPFDDESASCLVVGHELDKTIAEKIGCKFLSTEDFVNTMKPHM